MALSGRAFDASSSGAANPTDSHTPSGTPRALLIFVTELGGSQVVTSVDYGTNTDLPEVSVSPVEKAATEGLTVSAYFLGTGIVTGTQTMTINGAAAERVWAIYTWSADDDCTVNATQTISSDALENPSATLSLGGVTSAVALGLGSGHQPTANITPLSGWTSVGEAPGSTASGASYGYDTIASTDVTVGWTQTEEDAVMLAVAVREGAAGTPIPIFMHHYRNNIG